MRKFHAYKIGRGIRAVLSGENRSFFLIMLFSVSFLLIKSKGTLMLDLRR